MVYLDKKKLISSELQSWHWFIPLFAFVFVMFSFILSGNSYAITNDELRSAFADLYDNYSTAYPNTVYYQPNLTDDVLTNYQSILNYSDNFYISYPNNNNKYVTLVLAEKIYISGSDVRFVNGGQSGISALRFNGYNNGIDSNVNVNSLVDNDFNVWNSPIYISSDSTVIYKEPNFNFFTNSITLVSSSGPKFSFNDFNQCRVYITGDWDFYDDFTFWVERYINNDWEVFTSTLDYYKLLNHENPYYVHWNNMNYFPVGTYRYRALLNDSLDSYFYSDSFEITQSVIDNSATGTVDNNGDIDITVDTGATVDNIKDFLGQDATVTDEQFSDNFPTVEVDDPSEDFFSWIFDQIENIFTSTTAQTLQFELFGTTYSYSSNDVYVPNNTLKTFIGLYCDFSICMWIIKDVRKVINKIKEGNIEALSDEDITANMV